MATILVSSFGNGTGVDQAGTQAAVNTAVAGDTVVLSAGTGTWGAAVNISTPITIKGQGTLTSTGGRGSTGSQATVLINNTHASSGAEIPLFNVAMSSNQRQEIYGIYMQASNAAGLYGCNGINVFNTTSVAIPQQAFFHDCTFDSMSFPVYNSSGNGSAVFGVCFFCTFINNRISSRNAGCANASQAGSTPPPSPAWGTGLYMIYEDNLYQYGNFGNFPLPNGWTGGPQGGNYFGDTEFPMNYIIRHNTYTVNRPAALGITVDAYDMHGDQKLHYNAMGFIIHDNAFNYTGSSTNVKLADCRGGVGSVVFNNTFTGQNGNYVQVRANANSPGDSTLPTQTYIYNNTNADGTTIVVNPSDGATQGVNYFLNAPSGYSEVAYPSPLRAASPFLFPGPLSGTATETGASVGPNARRVLRPLSTRF